ncbi:esterase-like activity of phytase family protein [Cognatishimia maritima]|uniref:Phytase-like domain-containing protein n=1 Tax=Cognatishimia maritima TaxID=870908 RepID=A0A1M5T3D1_9RHOB|nr:esterase-like activity of phytase family protein [Cognatishimia maritima]SHH45192.1 hypothetical protein SAMN04488044_2569 [Cognatishimia maritima]
MRKRLAIALGLAVLIGWQVSATPDGVAQHVSTLKWNRSDAWFGGFSAIEVASDGANFTALSDSGTLVMGQLQRAQGQLSAVKMDRALPVYDHKGPIRWDRNRDTEGLAIRADGHLFVSFEGRHRVFSYAKPGTLGKPLKRHADFKKMAPNGSLEALAIDAHGRLYTLAETPNPKGADLAVYRFEKGVWTQAFALPARNGFRPVGADFGPDGLFYLLERKFNGIGFRTRVRRFDLSDGVVRSEETVLQTRTGVHDNLEGLAVWEDSDGQVRLTMISDDNFMFYQRTEIVEYRLPAAS